MGQKPSKLEVAESCLKPHHPHKCSDVDLRKLRALIKSGKLSPCYLPYEGEDWDARGVGLQRTYVAETGRHEDLSCRILTAPYSPKFALQALKANLEHVVKRIQHP